MDTKDAKEKANEVADNAKEKATEAAEIAQKKGEELLGAVNKQPKNIRYAIFGSAGVAVLIALSVLFSGSSLPKCSDSAMLELTKNTLMNTQQFAMLKIYQAKLGFSMITTEKDEENKRTCLATLTVNIEKNIKKYDIKYIIQLTDDGTPAVRVWL